jgi:uncharacterized membrane protein YraQ (UPF0718 family)
VPDSALTQFLSVIVEEIRRMWWFFLVACLLVGIIKGYKLDLKIRHAVNRSGFWGILIAIAVGMVSPLCACGILPVVISLALMGTPLPPLMALLATSPTMGPDALLLTWRGLGSDLAIWKIIGSGVLGLCAGAVTLMLERRGWLNSDLVRLKPVYREDGTLASAHEVGKAYGIKLKTMTVEPRANRARFIFDRTVDAALFTGKFLLLAIVLEALLVTFVPISWITVLVGQPGIQSLVAASLIGLPLPSNQIPIIPILAGLIERGIDPGAALTLLLAGPVTSLPAIIALWGMFHRRVVGVFLAVGLCASIGVGWIYQLTL